MRFKSMIMTLALLCGSTATFAQAYDGEDDVKYSAGYINVGGASGIRGSYDYGINDYVSIGANVDWFFNPAKADDDHTYLLNHLDADVHGQFHFNSVCSMPEEFDLYAGVSAGLKNLKLQGGLRYNVSDEVGIYAQIEQNIISSPLPQKFNNFKNDFGISIGFTYTIY